MLVTSKLTVACPFNSVSHMVTCKIGLFYDNDTDCIIRCFAIFYQHGEINDLFIYLHNMERYLLNVKKGEVTRGNDP